MTRLCSLGQICTTDPPRTCTLTVEGSTFTIPTGQNSRFLLNFWSTSVKYKDESWTSELNSCCWAHKRNLPIPEQVLASERPRRRCRRGFESKLNHEERSHCIPSHNEALNLVSRPPSFPKQKISQKVPGGDLFWSHHTVVSFLHSSSCFSSHTGGSARRKRPPPPSSPY